MIPVSVGTTLYAVRPTGASLGPAKGPALLRLEVIAVSEDGRSATLREASGREAEWVLAREIRSERDHVACAKFGPPLLACLSAAAAIDLAASPFDRIARIAVRRANRAQSEARAIRALAEAAPADSARA